MHDHNDNKNFSMMWMMIPCILLLGILFFAGGRSFSGGYLAPILFGVFVIAHIRMMFKRHGGHKDDDAEDEIDGTPARQPETKDGHQHGGCCH